MIEPNLKLARKLIREHRLARITISVNAAHVITVAYPDTFNPIVEQRRTAAFKKKGGSVSMAEADEIIQQSMDEIVRCIDRTIEGALLGLQAGLDGDPS